MVLKEKRGGGGDFSYRWWLRMAQSCENSTQWHMESGMHTGCFPPAAAASERDQLACCCKTVSNFDRKKELDLVLKCNSNYMLFPHHHWSTAFTTQSKQNAHTYMHTHPCQCRCDKEACAAFYGVGKGQLETSLLGKWTFWSLGESSYNSCGTPLSYHSHFGKNQKCFLNSFVGLYSL